MDNIAKKWLGYAKADLEAAEVLSGNPKTNYSYQLAVLHCHQAIEKILKTVLVSSGQEPKRTHDLIKLAETSKLKLSQEFESYLKQLNIHYQPARYPDIQYDDNLKYDKDTAEYHFEKTKELFSWIEKQLK